MSDVLVCPDAEVRCIRCGISSHSINYYSFGVNVKKWLDCFKSDNFLSKQPIRVKLSESVDKSFGLT